MDLALIFRLFLFSLRIRFFLHLARILTSATSSNIFYSFCWGLSLDCEFILSRLSQNSEVKFIFSLTRQWQQRNTGTVPVPVLVPLSVFFVNRFLQSNHTSGLVAAESIPLCDESTDFMHRHLLLLQGGMLNRLLVHLQIEQCYKPNKLQ